MQVWKGLILQEDPGLFVGSMYFFVCGNNEYLWNNDFDDYQNDFLQAKSESHVLPLLEFRQLVVKLRAKSAF